MLVVCCRTESVNYLSSYIVQLRKQNKPSSKFPNINMPLQYFKILNARTYVHSYTYIAVAAGYISCIWTNDSWVCHAYLHSKHMSSISNTKPILTPLFFLFFRQDILSLPDPVQVLFDKLVVVRALKHLRAEIYISLTVVIKHSRQFNLHVCIVRAQYRTYFPIQLLQKQNFEFLLIAFFHEMIKL